MSENEGTPQAQEGQEQEVDLSKYVPVAEFMKYKSKVEASEKAEAERKQREMTSEQRAIEVEKENATMKESLLTAQAQLDDIVASARADLLGQLPEDRQDRVKDWPVEQLKTYVSDFAELTNAGKGIPGGKPGAGAVGEMGGYESYTEWAQKDPAGYRAYRNTESRSEIVWARETSQEA